MLSPSDFRAIVSGQRRGIGGMLWRAAFYAASVPYSIAMRIETGGHDTQHQANNSR